MLPGMPWDINEMPRKARYRNRPIKYYSAKRRAIYERGDDINHLELFEKYHWVCHLCGTKIDRKLRFPNHMAATVDHIIPLSKGGEHVWANTRPAHGLCNFKKSDDMPESFNLQSLDIPLDHVVELLDTQE